MTQAQGEGWELRRAEALSELSTLADNVVDLVLTDPPYSSGGAFRGDRAGYDSRKKYVTSSAKHHLPALVWGTKGPLPGKPTPDSVYLPGAFSVSVPRSERLHVAPKPVELLRRLCALAPDGGVVLDPFAGSGSTLVAAVEEGRRAFGFEFDDHYFQVAAERLRGLPCTST